MNTPVKIKSQNSFLHRVLDINWGLVLLICAISGVGFLALYSAAGASLSPWANKQIARFCVGLVGMFVMAFIDIKWWYKLAFPIYILGFFSLVYVELVGHVGMGAQRWISIGGLNIQPSEFMKIAVVLMLARYFHNGSKEDMSRILYLIIPALIILLPVAMVMQQPDLGTSLMIVMAGVGMFFIAGAPIYLFLIGIGAVIAAIPVAWHFMHEYQKRRVMTFLNPESDPLGAGYHITQSKIAIGSGGVEGKGFLNGSQSHLNFLPEKQTDFIFTLIAEEWGLLGGITLLSLFGLVFFYGLILANKSRQKFKKFLVLGLVINFSLYVFINISMVMGLIPVVGAPLPLISYGGTSMLAALVSFGLILSCSVYRDSKVTRV